jgi:hypothetical protein
MAPFFIACTESAISARALRKITGSATAAAASWRWTSRPLSPGSCRSRMTQPVSARAARRSAPRS